MSSPTASVIDHIPTESENEVTKAIEELGLTPVANFFGMWPSNVQKWRDNGCLPETDLSGRTKYAAGIERLSRGKYSAAKMLAASREVWAKRPVRRGPTQKGRARV